MSKIKYILPLALLVSGTVNAEEAENPWYAGARLGGTHYSDISNLPAGIDIDKDDWGGGVFLGYNISPWFALETGYTYLGEAELSDGFGNTATIEQEAIDLVGKFTWNTTDSLDIFAKLGGAYYFAEAEESGFSVDDDGLIATAGLGIEYFFNKNVSARLEYQYYHDMEIDDVDVDWDTHFYGLSLVYGWGAAEPMVMAEPEPMVMAEPEPMVMAEPEPMVMAEPEMIEIAPLTVELPFAFDSDELPQEYLDQLAPIAQHLVDYPEAQLFVVGHTDSRGSETYNQQLSEQRAALIGDYLATHYDIEKSRIIEEGRGELEPRAGNDTDEERALNRRVSVFTPGLKVENK